MGSWESANPSECAFGVRLLALQGCGIIFGADLCLPHPPLSSKPCARFYEIVLHESVGSMEHLDGYPPTALCESGRACAGAKKPLPEPQALDLFRGAYIGRGRPQVGKAPGVGGTVERE